MPLIIAYPPVNLPQQPAPLPRAPAITPEPAASTVGEAPCLSHIRPRDFGVRLRRKDTVSIRRALASPRRGRQRIGLIVALGSLGTVFGPVGWGRPGGIEPAEAHAAGHLPATLPRVQEASLRPTAFIIDGSGGDTIVSDGPAARPLTAAGTAQDRWRALQCLTAAVYYEAASEPEGGQRAVAQVVLNRVAHPAYPGTVCGVVYQGSERPGCQFSFACDGSLVRRPIPAIWERARRVAADALAGRVYAPVGLATHYHTTSVHPYWADSLAALRVIGAHRFYRWHGKAGRPAAFTCCYTGGEPLPGPHPRTWSPAPADMVDPVALARAFEEGRLLAAHAAQYPSPAAGTTHANAAFGQALPPHATTPTPDGALAQRGGDALSRTRTPAGSGTVLPRWDRAGTWIVQPGS